MFKRLLIANRGEIACRIIRTAKRLGITTVAIYSDVDSLSPHVALADIAIPLGPAASQASYLDQSRILKIAQDHLVDAIHPGYGFLSENTQFAEAIQAHGMCFIGPSSQAIAQMGEKNTAKALMAQHQVPIVPGYHGADQNIETLRQEAQRVGFPLLIKASLGGGGKGMRIVHEPAELDAALAATQREAQASFGDSHLLLEKYCEAARHIEVQILADQHGNTLALFDRDCSLQRRCQKIIEEAPAPGLSAATRQAMQAAAVNAARAVSYVGAGTIEFLLTPEHTFYFMEMNTRLQVEHPVTEMITGIDLVEWQLRVADGEPLPWKQDELTATGHALEARLYAEDPDNDFLPTTGYLIDARFPLQNTSVRVDSGIVSGNTITPYYDPMLAKIISYGDTREQAISTLQQALQHTALTGPKTNRDFLLQALSHPQFQQALHSTTFVADCLADLLPQATQPNEILTTLATAAYYYLQHDPQRRTITATGLASPRIITLYFSGEAITRSVQETAPQQLVITHHDHADFLRYTAQDAEITMTIGDQQYTVRAFLSTEQLFLWHHAHCYVFQRRPARQSAAGQEQANFISPMPGTITAVPHPVDSVVKRGDTLMILEAMKMEHAISAPTDGTITALHYAAGDLVQAGEVLLDFAPRSE